MALWQAASDVRTAAVEAWQLAQRSTVEALAARIGTYFQLLASTAEGIDVAAMPDTGAHTWLQHEAERFGVAAPTVRLRVVGPEGVMAQVNGPRGAITADPGWCSPCFEEGQLTYAGPRRGGRYVEVQMALSSFSPLLRPDHAWVVDRDRRIATHADINQIGTAPFTSVDLDPALERMLAHMGQGGTGSARYQWDGRERLASYAPVPGAPPGWSLGLSTSRAEALVGVQTAQNGMWFAIFGVFGTVGLIGGAWLASNAAARRRERALHEEQVALTRASAHADRLALVGTLTAGVAHDLRSPITALSMLVEELEDGAAPSEVKADMRMALDQVLAIVSDLGSFSRSSDDDHATDPTEAWATARRLLAPVLRRLAVHASLPPCPAVTISSTRLAQVLVNLVVNAAHVAHTVWVRVEVGESVTLVVEDDGPGIEEAARESVFEPYFTTKPDGEGTGLGLYLCRRFAREAGGDLTVDRSPHGGAAFRLTLVRATARLRLVES